MKILLSTIIEGITLFLIGIIIFLMVRFPEYIVYIYSCFAVLVVISHLYKLQFMEILVVIIGVLCGSLIFILVGGGIIGRIVILLEILYLLFSYVTLQKIDQKMVFYNTFWIEKKENIEEEVTRLKLSVEELKRQSSNVNFRIQNYNLLSKVLTKIASITSINGIKTFVLDTLSNTFPGTKSVIYINEKPSESTNPDAQIIEYVKKIRTYLYIPDVSSFSEEQIITSYRSILCFPIEVKGINDTTGYLIIYSEQKIDEEVVRFISILVHHMSISLTNIQLLEYTKELAITDSLTGLYVQRYFKELLEQEVKIADYYKKNLSLAIFDIDNFKQINDIYGHNVGDEVLVRFSNILKSRLRETDIISRYGGDEFVVILPNTSLEDAVEVCEEIREIVTKEVIVTREAIKTTFHKHRVKFAVSCGVCEYNVFKEKEEFSSWEKFLDVTDKLLYKAKTSGKDRIEKWKV